MLVFDLSTRRWSVNDDLYTSDIAASVTPVKSALMFNLVEPNDGGVRYLLIVAGNSRPGGGTWATQNQVQYDIQRRNS